MVPVYVSCHCNYGISLLQLEVLRLALKMICHCDFIRPLNSEHYNLHKNVVLTFHISNSMK